MQDFRVTLSSEPSKSFRCTKAANSLDIDQHKKLTHTLTVKADITTDYNIGLVVGASGSGKTTLARSMFGEDCFKTVLDPSRPVIDQFPESYNYNDCQKALSGIGLTSVPCWIRPAATLSNGQKTRAETALALALSDELLVIDEWTSVVDRNVAKVMSHSVQKYARSNNRRIVLVSCHYDVIDWLNPDWVIDCNKQTYSDRRSMVGTFQRTDQLRLGVKRCGRDMWRFFSQYHYLSERLPGGTLYLYGLYSGADQIGFLCFANYVIGKPKIMHFNRLVIHPDYVGLGIGIRFLNECCKDMTAKGFTIKGKFSSQPTYRALKSSDHWKLKRISRIYDKVKLTAGRKIKGSSSNAARREVKCYHFDYKE